MDSKTAAVDLKSSPLHLLKRVSQFAGNLFSEQVGPGGLTHRQFTVLLAVQQNEGASQTTLVKETGIDRSTLADLIARLLKLGYLQRRRTPEDGRTNTIKLSNTGRKVLLAAQPSAEKVDKMLLNLISASKRQTFMHCLQILAEAGGPEKEDRQPEQQQKARPSPKERSRVRYAHI